MKIYEKIERVLENNNFSVKNIFGKEKVRIMNL
jgi:hypothetical protein